jgi:hypothetical protein
MHHSCIIHASFMHYGAAVALAVSAAFRDGARVCSL